MKPNRKSLLVIPFVVLIAAMASGCIISSGEDSSLTVENDSSYAIYELYIAETTDSTWGPDLLGSDILYPGDAITVLLDCDYYDVLVVDEDGFQCELYDLDLCFDDAVWVIDNATLNSCSF